MAPVGQAFSLPPQLPSRHVFLGLDLGRRHDPAALAILHRVPEPTGRWNSVDWQSEVEIAFHLHHVERFPLGTPYTAIVEKVVRLVHHLPAHLDGLKTLVVDASGVGAPVVEMLRRARPRCRIIPITITASGHARLDGYGGYLVPRRDLITALRVLLERRLLRIPSAIHDKQALLNELLTLSDASGSHHDDLAIATALAAWQAARGLLPHATN